MSSSLETKFTGDSSQLEAAYQKIARENVKLREEMKKTHDEAEKGGEHANDLAEALTEHIGEQVRGYVEMGAELLTIHKAQELISEELERQNELREKALEFQTEAGAARPQLYRNLAGLSREEMAEVKERLENLQAAFSIPHESTLNAAAVQAISATGGDTQKGLANLEQALKMVPDAAQHPEELADLAGGLGDLAKVTGEQDAEKNLGFLLAVQHGARVTSLANASQNLIPAALSLSQHGASMQEAFAVLGSLGQAIEDPMGAETGTGAIKFAEKLDEFFSPKGIEERITKALSSESGKEASGASPDAALRGRIVAYAESHGLKGAAGYDFGDLMKALREQHLMRGLVESESARVTSLAGEHEFGRQVQALRENQDLREQFESQKGVFGRAKTIGALRGFVESGDSVMGQFYDQEKGALPSGAAAAALARETVSQLHGDAAVRALQAGQASEVFSEQAFTADQPRSRQAAYQKAFGGLLDITHQGFGSSLYNLFGRQFFAANLHLGGQDAGDMFRREARAELNLRRYQARGVDEIFGGYESDAEIAARLKAGTLEPIHDRGKEAEATRIEVLLERMVELLEADHHQSKEHHRENQTTARQNGARAQAAKRRGTE